MIASSSNEGYETNESSSSSTSGAVTEAANPSVSEKRAEEVKEGPRTVTVTGTIFVLLWVGYLVLIQLLVLRGVILVPSPPEALNP